jgi:LPXTG-motif cell wall-anchored protein
MNGLGLITETSPIPTTFSVSPTIKPVTLAPTPTTTVQKSVWDTINQGLNVLQSGANIYSQVKSGSSAPGYNPSLTTTQTQPGQLPQQPMPTPSNTKKYVLIGLGVAALGGIIYFAARKKKAKK